jgi:hypothetical protein
MKNKYILPERPFAIINDGWNVYSAACFMKIYSV